MESKKFRRNLRSHRDLDVYKKAFEAAMRIFELSKSFPPEERFSLTSQIRKASRSVCSNTSEGWRKRRYTNAFVSKISDAESEAAETQVWLEFAVRCLYLDPSIGRELYKVYDQIIGKLVRMASRPQDWSFNS